jgi:hypothetical protein
MADLKQTFEGLLNKISEAAVDFSELEVMTFTGDVNGLVKDGKVDWGSLLKNATADKTNLHLVAATKLQLDGDSYHFRTNAKPEEINGLDELLKLHNEAVLSSNQARQALFTFVSDTLIKLAPGK